MVDRVQPLKFESPDTGGTETDDFPTSVDRNEDFVDCRGVTVQDDSSDDDLVRVSRDGDNLTFLDKSNTVKTLTDLTTGGSLPAASQVGQVIFSVNGDSFTVEQPLTEYGCGWMINDFGEQMVTG